MKCITNLLIATVLIACNNNNLETGPLSIESKQHVVMDGMVGTWLNNDGISFERWTKVNDSLYQSVVFSINNNDTAWKERAMVFRKNENWVFENVVEGQNAGQAVSFTSTQIDSSKVQFSNPAHDFPTDIHYSLVNDSVLEAFIAGPNEKGGKYTIPFIYKRHSY
jgi:hypothetical protein